MFASVKRVVRSGFVGFWRNAYVSLASIFVMTIALFVLGTTLMVDQLLSASLQNIQSRVDINVYFTVDAPTEEIFALQSRIESLSEVADVRFTSREEALENFRRNNQNQASAILALEELGENPLGASLAIQANETSQYEDVAQFLDEQAAFAGIIDRVNYLDNKVVIDRLTAIIGGVEQATFFVMIILIIAAVLITFNTIRLAIYTTRDEISIMRLVGAGNSFIRGPFMLQGIMYGFIASLLALMILYPMVLWLGPRTEAFFEVNLYEYFVSDFFSIFFVIAGIGVFLGFISSTLAIARYLRV